ncbi:hypothetical protein [Streptomyces achromogenes]|uniref:hypothetical protein n=1 Tax=Streptomyces achromogenes TaxID=67255 RepID=UPI003694925E
MRRHLTAVGRAVRSALAEGRRGGETTRDQDAAAPARHVLSGYDGPRVLARVRPGRTALLNVAETLPAKP